MPAWYAMSATHCESGALAQAEGCRSACVIMDCRSGPDALKRLQRCERYANKTRVARGLSRQPDRRGAVQYAGAGMVAIAPSGHAGRTVTTEVGRGIIDWMSIRRSTENTGVTDCLIEQEPPLLRPPLQAPAISYQYLRQLQV